MTLSTLPAAYIISLTPAGSRLGRRIAQKMPEAVFWVPVACHPNYPEAQSFDDLKSLFAEAFLANHPLICIMATGIVVRHLAPLLKGKDVDPAVVVVDEAGRFAISLLSGHLGGANDLARTVGNLIGASAGHHNRNGCARTPRSGYAGSPAGVAPGKSAGGERNSYGPAAWPTSPSGGP